MCVCACVNAISKRENIHIIAKLGYIVRINIDCINVELNKQTDFANNMKQTNKRGICHMTDLCDQIFFFFMFCYWHEKAKRVNYKDKQIVMMGYLPTAAAKS